MKLPNLTRRGLFQGLGGIAAASTIEKAKVAGISWLPDSIDTRAPLGAETSKKFFTKFTDWLGDIGDKEIKEEAKYMNSIDPDLISLHLPLQTIVRIQQKRNYTRIKKSREDWFVRVLKRDGKVDWE